MVDRVVGVFDLLYCFFGLPAAIRSLCDEIGLGIFYPGDDFAAVVVSDERSLLGRAYSHHGGYAGFWAYVSQGLSQAL